MSLMAPSFVACDREQPFLLPPDVRDWLPEDHFVWFVIDAVDRIDVAAFYAAYRGDGRCRPAYEPAMMLALLLYAYARGTRFSRVIERVRGGRGVPGDRGAAAARSLDDRPVRRAPPAGAGGRVRRGARAVRERWPDRRCGRRDRRHQDPRQRQP